MRRRAADPGVKRDKASDRPGELLKRPSSSTFGHEFSSSKEAMAALESIVNINHFRQRVRALGIATGCRNAAGHWVHYRKAHLLEDCRQRLKVKVAVMADANRIQVPDPADIARLMLDGHLVAHPLRRTIAPVKIYQKINSIQRRMFNPPHGKRGAWTPAAQIKLETWIMKSPRTRVSKREGKFADGRACKSAKTEKLSASVANELPGKLREVGSAQSHVSEVM